jgi:hypothetical protein
LRHNAIYLRLSLVPLVWMAIPLALVVTHLHPFYGYTGLMPNTAALVNVQLRTAHDRRLPANVALEAPPEIRVETDAVRLASSNEVLWRIVPTAAGNYTMTVRIDSATVAKTLHVSEAPARRSPRRVAPGLTDQLFYPSEQPLPEDSPITAITVRYPELGLSVFGVRVHWMVIYAVLSMGCAFVLARRFGVTL